MKIIKTAKQGKSHQNKLFHSGWVWDGNPAIWWSCKHIGLHFSVFFFSVWAIKCVFLSRQKDVSWIFMKIDKREEKDYNKRMLLCLTTKVNWRQLLQIFETLKFFYILVKFWNIYIRNEIITLHIQWRLSLITSNY